MAFSTKDFPNLVFESVEDYNKQVEKKKRLLEGEKNKTDGTIEAIFIKADKDDDPELEGPDHNSRGGP